MKINAIDILKTENQLGLENIKLERLEKVVFLAGKNGSGKTRILDLITDYVQKKPHAEQIQQAQEMIDELEKLIAQDQQELTLLERQRSNYSPQKISHPNRFVSMTHTERIEHYDKQIDTLENEIIQKKSE